MEATHEGDTAADEAGDPGCAAVQDSDAFRIFDNIYVLTGGSNDTASVSILGYDNLFKAFNIGLGSAISVLVFASVAVIAFIYIKVVQGVRARRRERGALMAERIGARRAAGWIIIDTLVVVYALLPVLWILSLSLKPTSNVKDGKLIPSSITLRTTGNLHRPCVQLGFDQLDRNRADHHDHRRHDRRHGGYAVARLDFPGKKVLIGAALLIAMFPQISLVTPLFNIERRIGLFDTWPGLIIPYITFALPLAIYTLSAFFREIPWDLEKAAKMDGATPVRRFGG